MNIFYILFKKVTNYLNKVEQPSVLHLSLGINAISNLGESENP
jgi:hypothetical protein